MVFSRKSASGSGHSKCKGSEAKPCLTKRPLAGAQEKSSGQRSGKLGPTYTGSMCVSEGADQEQWGLLMFNRIAAGLRRHWSGKSRSRRLEAHSEMR
jgi:hypothetical protein